MTAGRVWAYNWPISVSPPRVPIRWVDQPPPPLVRNWTTCGGAPVARAVTTISTSLPRATRRIPPGKPSTTSVTLRGQGASEKSTMRRNQFSRTTGTSTSTASTVPRARPLAPASRSSRRRRKSRLNVTRPTVAAAKAVVRASSSGSSGAASVDSRGSSSIAVERLSLSSGWVRSTSNASGPSPKRV